MPKTILITGATDGIGLETAKILADGGHEILLHGRSQAKLDATAKMVGGKNKTYLADLSDLGAVAAMAETIKKNHDHIDVLINNAGVLKAPKPVLANGRDIRFVVNTLAPYILTEKLLPSMNESGRVVNLSSAAQAPVNETAMRGDVRLDDMAAYSQSKLAITMWSQDMARKLPEGPVFVSVNPGSLLATKMVKEGFGIAGNDISIGSDILVSAALSEEFADASGKYYDNDARRFGPPHADASDTAKVTAVVKVIEDLAAQHSA